jgi:hypothetical protein
MGIVAASACDRAIHRPRAHRRAMQAEKEAGYADVDEVVASTSAPAAIIEK